MKQNTKFLWMYIGILFSFALILIVFAGLSRNSDIEQKEGLQGHVARLSEEKLTLTNKINSQAFTDAPCQHLLGVSIHDDGKIAFATPIEQIGNIG